MAVTDPTLETAQAGLAREFEGDAVFWLATWAIVALRDMSDRLAPDDFDQAVNPILSFLGLD